MRKKLLASPESFPGLAAALFSKDVTTQSEIVDKLEEIKPIAERDNGSR